MADGGTDGRRFFFTRTRQATSTEEIGTSRRPAAAHTAQSSETERRETREIPLSRHSPPTQLHASHRWASRERPAASRTGSRRQIYPPRCASGDRPSPCLAALLYSSWHCAGELAEPSATSVSLSAALLSPDPLGRRRRRRHPPLRPQVGPAERRLDVDRRRLGEAPVEKGGGGHLVDGPSGGGAQLQHAVEEHGQRRREGAALTVEAVDDCAQVEPPPLACTPPPASRTTSLRAAPPQAGRSRPPWRKCTRRGSRCRPRAVVAGVRRPGVVREYLWRRVRLGAAHLCGTRTILDVQSQPQVAHLHVVPPDVGEQQVLQLQVTMRDAVRVHVLDRCHSAAH